MKIEWVKTTIVVWTRGAHNIITEFPVIAQVYCVIHTGFVSQKLLQVAVNYLYRLSNPPRNVHK